MRLGQSPEGAFGEGPRGAGLRRGWSLIERARGDDMGVCALRSDGEEVSAKNMTLHESTMAGMGWLPVGSARAWKAKELTPAMRSRAPQAPAEGCLGANARPESTTDWTFALSVLRWRMGITRFATSASAAAATPPSPAAHSPWPSQLFGAPRMRGSEALPVAERRIAAPPISIGSPSAVPVPCSCRRPTWPASSAASRRAVEITSRWLGPFGAVSELLRPSCPTAVPRMIRAMGCADAPASSRETTRAASQPSPRT